MKRIERTLFITKESLDFIEKDINAKESYTIFSNKEEGTIEASVAFLIPEEFRVSEEALNEIIMGLLPALSDKQIAEKVELVKNHLRTLGASV
jgi:hypothetical protein